MRLRRAHAVLEVRGAQIDAARKAVRVRVRVRVRIRVRVRKRVRVGVRVRDKT